MYLVALAVMLLAQAGNPTEERIEQLYSEAKSLQNQGDLAGASVKYESIIQLSPNLAAAYNNLGALYFRQRDFPKAAAVLAKGLKINPNLASAHALLGISLYEMADYPAARTHLETALSAKPDDNNAELFLVNDLTKLGDFDAVAKHLQQLSKRQPNNQQVWYLLGKVYMQLAEQALGKINAIDPDSIWAHQISSELMESMKNYDGAIVEMKKAVEMAPAQPGLHYKLGDLYGVQQQWDAAYAQFQAELTIDPHNCRTPWKLGNVLLQQNIRPDDSLADFNQALTACPNLSEARLDRGRLLLKLRRSNEALPDLLAAEKDTPSEPSIHFLLAQVYRSLGRAEEAQDEMQTFSKLDESARAATAERAQEVIKNKEAAQHQ